MLEDVWMGGGGDYRVRQDINQFESSSRYSSRIIRSIVIIFMMPPLKLYECSSRVEVGIDEVGRGALAGPVVVAAVIWSGEPSADDLTWTMIRDSKKLSSKRREMLADYIRDHAVDYSVCRVEAGEIDDINIFHATMKAMHGALDDLDVDFDHILVDGDRFKSYINPRTDIGFVDHTCVVRGDDVYVSIAAASIIAKVTRDDIMAGYEMHDEFPMYDWKTNKGYGTATHVEAVKLNGPSRHHRRTFLRNIVTIPPPPPPTPM